MGNKRQYLGFKEDPFSYTPSLFLKKIDFQKRNKPKLLMFFFCLRVDFESSRLVSCFYALTLSFKWCFIVSLLVFQNA